jgi:hypothetical protein
MTARLLTALCASGLVGLLAAGCTDRPVLYKQGEYQGKVDSQPFDNALFKGNRTEWEKALKARSQGQDEYSRAAAASK